MTDERAQEIITRAAEIMRAAKGACDEVNVSAAGDVVYLSALGGRVDLKAEIRNWTAPRLIVEVNASSICSTPKEVRARAVAMLALAEIGAAVERECGPMMAEGSKP